MSTIIEIIFLVIVGVISIIGVFIGLGTLEDKQEKLDNETFDAYMDICQKNGINLDIFEFDTDWKVLCTKIQVVIKLKDAGYLEFDESGMPKKVVDNK